MIYRLDSFAFDVENRELRNGRLAVSIEPQVFDLLRVLIENRGRLVTKEELLQQVWKGRVVSDAALSSRIKAARHAIGDDGTTQKYIKTIHGRGFRFTGNIVIEDDGAPGRSTGKTAAAVAGQSGRPQRNKTIIAVLPFTNMSTGPDHAYFADGITEDIRTALSQISALSVIACSPTAPFEERSTKGRETARGLGAQHLVEGSVRKFGNRARITARLIDVTDGNHLWSERYDRELDDIFEVQDDITRNIAIALQVQLTTGHHAGIWQSGTRRYEAWQHQMRGQQAYYKATREGRGEAIECFRNAVAVDPDYVQARAALGHAYTEAARHGETADPAASLRQAEEIAEALISEGMSQAAGQNLLGFIRSIQGRHQEAVAARAKAVELSPDPKHQAGLAFSLVYANEPRRAVKCINTALRLSPNYPNWFTGTIVMAHYLLGDLELAREAAEDAVSRFPDYPEAYINLTGIYSASNQSDQARAMAEKVLRMNPAFSLEKYSRSQPFKDADETETWIGHLRNAGLPD